MEGVYYENELEFIVLTFDEKNKVFFTILYYFLLFIVGNKRTN